MKKLDKLLITNFIAPFIATFFIALFVLVMQFLWKYIDDIIGKGLDISLILELIMYRSTALFPMAFPIAVLISSVMVMGDLGEHYELASMKSAGIPLWRIMAPLMFACTMIMIVSYSSANYLMPYSNLKFKSRLYDIRKQKPTLSLEDQTFNDDFKGFVIRIGEKAENGQDLKDVLIYNHSQHGQHDQAMAKRGEMFITPDQHYMVMKLYDGNQYRELSSSPQAKKGNHPYIHTSFGEWEKIFDLREFEFNATDEDLFKSQHSMLSTAQLLHAIDSLNQKIERSVADLDRKVKPYYRHHLKKDSTQKFVPIRTNLPKLTKDIPERFAVGEREIMYRQAGALARRVKDNAEHTIRRVDKAKVDRVLHQNELHRKFSFAFSCLMFLFIGAPMGAIIRKGGFGWPLLVAIFFFVLFIVFFMTGEKMAKQMVVSSFVGIWLPNLILLPVGILLTYKAMNDSKVLDISSYTAPFIRLYAKVMGDKV